MRETDNVSSVIIHAEGKSKVNIKSLPSTVAHHSTVGFPYRSVDKETACNFCKRLGFDPWVGRSTGEGNSNPLQYSCLKNPMDGEAWRATVHGVARVGHDLVAKPPTFYCLFLLLLSV